MMISQMPDLTTTPGAISGPKAFAMAGVKPSEVDVLMGYDSFTITQLLHFEDLGFCAKGEGGPFVESTDIGPGGSLPTNTNGGGLSYTHPGMYGMFLIVEAVRQLRGECGARQVDGADIGWRTAPGWCCRACRRACSAPRPRCDGTLRTADHRRQRAVLGRDTRAALRGAVVHGVRLPIFYPRRGVPRVFVGRRVEWRESSGRGTVYAVSVQHRPANPTMADVCPMPSHWSRSTPAPRAW